MNQTLKNWIAKLSGTAKAISTSDNVSKDEAFSRLISDGVPDELRADLKVFAGDLVDRKYENVHGAQVPGSIESSVEKLTSDFIALTSLHIDKPTGSESVAKKNGKVKDGGDDTLDDEEDSDNFSLKTGKKVAADFCDLAEFTKVKAKDNVYGDVIEYQDSYLFKVGDYPDKEFSLTDEEMENAVELFPGLPKPKVNYAHNANPGPLDNKMGYVKEIRKDGDKLFGTVVVPKWLGDELPDVPKVSCEWDRDDKVLTGLALVTYPRIKDAALMADTLMAAFNNATSKEFNSMSYETNPHQKFHDIAACMGAECSGSSNFSVKQLAAYAKAAGFDSNTADFITPALLKSIQKHHDSAVDDGASCSEFAANMKAGNPLAHQYDFKGKRNYFNMSEVNDTMVKPAEFSQLQADFAAAVEKSKELEAKNLALETKVTEFATTLEAVNVELEKTRKDSQFASDSGYLELLKADGRLTPAEFDKWVEVAKENPIVFATAKDALDLRTPVINMESVRLTSPQRAADASKFGGDPNKFAKNEVNKVMSRDSVQYSVALKTVCKENPGLAELIG